MATRIDQDGATQGGRVRIAPPAVTGFYSDPHIGHPALLKYCERPFRDLDHQDEELVARYNAVIGPSDLVVWCGDVYLYSRERAAAVVGAMHGRKILVRGNHDKGVQSMTALGFDFVVMDLFLHMGGRNVRVNHFPYAGATHGIGGKVDTRFPDLRPTRKQGEVLIHGHTHDKRRRRDNQIHVGVDAWDYAPALWADVEALVREV